MSEYETRTLSLLVVKANEPIFSEMATTIRITDEAGGEFVEVEQHGRDLGKIQVCQNEWPALRDAIDKMMKACK